MYKGATKVLAIGLLALAATACADKAHDGALELCAQAQQQIDARNYAGALVMLDTLNSRYADQVAVRRDALRLRAMAMEGLATDSISAASATLAQATLDVEALEPDFRHITSSVGLDGYYIPKSAKTEVMTGNAIQPRVSEQGHFYLVANVDRAIGLQAVEFVDGHESISSGTISPARVVKVEGSEGASFNPEDLEGVGAWIVDHPSASKYILRGSKTNVSQRMDAPLRTQIAQCYRYAEALQAKRLALLKREKYERMLATARDQIANLPLPSQQK